MVNYRIKMIGQDDKLENARVMDVTVGQKRFVTPFKTMSSPRSMHLLEIYQKADEKLMREAREGKTVLDRIPRICKRDTVNLIVPEYRDPVITDTALCDLENRIHPHTDVVVVPRWDGILKLTGGSALSEKLWAASRRYIEEVRKINGKLIMGNIPMNRPQSVIDRLIGEYFKEGITSLVLDYESCQAPGKAHIVRDITKKLSVGGFGEESLLYQINMKKSHDFSGIKPADDFLSFVNGVDILGNYHLQSGRGKPNIAKIFDPGNWVYFDGEIGSRRRNEINDQNHEMINKEAEIVKKGICEDGSALKLVKTKRGASEYIRMTDQTTLDFGGIGWA